LLKLLGSVPRAAALSLTKIIAWLAYLFSKRLRKIAEKNLCMALPEVGEREKHLIVRGFFLNLGRLLGEFSQLLKLNRGNISSVVVYDGFENYAASVQRGKGTLFLTAHFGAWELCPVAHAVYGHPLKFVVRPIDNPWIDRLVNRYRTFSGNEIIAKKNSLKDILQTLKKNQGVGILIDQNTTLDAGIFANYFNIPACTTPSLAAIALRTDATVVPGVLIWDEKLRKHRLHFEPPVDLIRTGRAQADIAENTLRFNQILEGLVRQHPDQWLWGHRRWKTRPPGEKNLY